MQPGTTVEVDCREDAKGRTARIFRFRGDISSASQDALLGTYSRLTESERAQRLVLDFTKVEYINSSGIALVIQLLMEAGKAGERVTLFGLTPHFQKVFAMVGIGKYAGMYADEAAALVS